MKIDLTPSQRRALRAKAHHLHPVVTIGQHGLTPAVLHEVDVALLAHELIKIRAFSEGRDARDALLEQICAAMAAASVQHLGKVFTIWRQAPAVETPATTREKRQRGPAARSTGKTSTPPATAGKSQQRRALAESAAGAAGKRRKVTAGKAPKSPAERKYAPPTAKGPFEPGRRAPRAAGAKAPSPAARSRRRRTQA